MSMIVGLWLLCVAVVSLLLLVVTRWQRFEKLGAEIAAALLIAIFPFLWTSELSWPLVVAAVVLHLWLLVLPARLLLGRLERAFLKVSTRFSALIGLLLAAAIVALDAWGWRLANETTLLVVAVVVVNILLWGTVNLLLNTRRYKLHQDGTPWAVKDLPTVSVCIPARNEDQALTECLQHVLASDYPKLEVLVLDDCSQDQTSSVIRSFAHDGVRFVPGDVPASGWLGKNQAMQTLAKQASGYYLLFLSVDTHLAPDSVSRLVQYALHHQLHMVSVLPRNRLGVTLGTMLGTLQYFWRIVQPITKRHQPVSSKCWLISAKGLASLGSFDSVRHKVVPEESFAHRLFVRDTYRFLISDKVLSVTTGKKWSSQVETSLRLLYPYVKRQPMLVLMAVLLMGAVGVVPFVAAIVLAVTLQITVVAGLIYGACALLLVNFCLFLARAQPRSWWLAALVWPFVAAQEIILLVVSMVMYEFGEVNWKGRNVCYPVLGTPASGKDAPRPTAYLQWRRNRPE